MNHILKSIIISILTSSTVIFGFIFILKKYFENFIKTYFYKDFERLKHNHFKEISILKNKLDFILNRQSELYKNKLDGFRDLSSAIYSCRLSAKDVIENIENINQDMLIFKLEEYEKQRLYLNNCISQNRIFIEDKIFKKLHELKHEFETFAVYLKLINTKDINKENMIEKLKKKYYFIDKYYLTLTNYLQEEIYLKEVKSNLNENNNDCPTRHLT